MRHRQEGTPLSHTTALHRTQHHADTTLLLHHEVWDGACVFGHVGDCLAAIGASFHGPKHGRQTLAGSSSTTSSCLCTGALRGQLRLCCSTSRLQHVKTAVGNDGFSCTCFMLDTGVISEECRFIDYYCCRQYIVRCRDCAVCCVLLRLHDSSRCTAVVGARQQRRFINAGGLYSARVAGHRLNHQVMYYY